MTNAQHKALASYILAAGGALLAAATRLHWLPPELAGVIIAAGAAYRGWRDQTTTAVSVQTVSGPGVWFDVDAGSDTIGDNAHVRPVEPPARDLRTEIPAAHWLDKNAGVDDVFAEDDKRTP